MENLRFLTLKTPDGRAVGYARIAGGMVELRGVPKGAVAVFTDEGVYTGDTARIRIDGAVGAIALHSDGYLIALAREKDTAWTEDTIRARLMAASTEPKREAAVETVEAVAEAAEPVLEPTEPVFAEVAEPAPEPSEPAFAAEAEPETTEPAFAAEAVALPDTVEESAAESEAFMAILRRADRVFREAMERKPPDPAYQPIVDNEPIGMPYGEETVATSAGRGTVGTPFLKDRGSWEEEVERLLEDLPEGEWREPIANPFPNIFPSARFLRVHRDGGIDHLSGEWTDIRTGQKHRITAVRGTYSPRPPKRLPDFTRYIRSRSGGYWVKTEPIG